MVLKCQKWSVLAAILVVLAIIAYRYTDQVLSEQEIVQEVSDDTIDELLWPFFVKWNTKNQSIGKFKSTMTKMLRVFADDVTGTLASRFRERLNIIIKQLEIKKRKEAKEHVRPSKKAGVWLRGANMYDAPGMRKLYVIVSWNWGEIIKWM